MMTFDNVKNLKKHLRNQIKEADSVNSEWVYILKVEAEKCLELAEAEDSIMKTVKVEADESVANRRIQCPCCMKMMDVRFVTKGKS